MEARLGHRAHRACAAAVASRCGHVVGYYAMPLLRKFKTDSACYVYNGCTNDIVEVGELIYALIDSCDVTPDAEVLTEFGAAYPPAAVRLALARIRELKAPGGLLCCTTPTACAFRHRETEIRRQIRSCLQQVTLVVTEDCNLRCNYCIYGGSYEGSRVHSPRQMSLETARASVDYFAAHSDSSEPPLALGFYGGEPLLRFDFIKEIVAYGRARLSHPVLFTVTTNGTLLNEARIRFLHQHDFSIVVSIDGPPEVHDRNRRFKNGGTGSSATVLRNLRRLKDFDPVYARTMVTANMVLTSPVDLIALDQFVSELGIRPRISVLQTFGSALAEQMAPHAQGRTTGVKRLMEKYASAVIDGSLAQQPIPADHLFARGLYGASVRRIHTRQRGADFPAGRFAYGNICVPGATKLFVASDGTLYVCDRVDGMPALSLGNIATGVDEAKVLNLIDQFDTFRTTTCRDCWAIRLCNMCFFSTCHFDGWNEAKAAHYCDMRRREGTNALRLYCSIMEQAPDALDAIPAELPPMAGGSDPANPIAAAVTTTHRTMPSP